MRETSGKEIAAGEERRLLRLELQSATEAYEATNEELKAAHEEATSMNEELQSANEELETSKEELQSINEELTTVNSQLQAKITQLEATTNDIANLLSSTDIAVVFLDAKFRVRRFTAPVTDLLELIDTDIGRPVTDLAQKFNDDKMLSDAPNRTAAPGSHRTRSGADSGRWYLRRTLPYRTSEDRIEGVVITFVDIGARKRSELEVFRRMSASRACSTRCRRRSSSSIPSPVDCNTPTARPRASSAAACPPRPRWVTALTSSLCWPAPGAAANPISPRNGHWRAH